MFRVFVCGGRGWALAFSQSAPSEGVDFAQEQANRLQRTTAEFKEFMEAPRSSSGKALFADERARDVNV